MASLKRLTLDLHPLILLLLPLLITISSIKCSSTEQQNAEAEKQKMLVSLRRNPSMISVDEMAMFMLDRFEHCDPSFNERPFVDKLQILTSIMTKCVEEYLVSKLSTVEMRLRDHAFDEETTIIKHLNETDPTLARQTAVTAVLRVLAIVRTGLWCHQPVSQRHDE